VLLLLTAAITTTAVSAASTTASDGSSSSSTTDLAIYIDRAFTYLCIMYVFIYLFIYRYAPHNYVSVNDGPHIRRWSHNITI